MFNKHMLYRVREVKEVTVIQLEVATGEGTEKSPVRTVIEFWTKEGELIGRIDPLNGREIDSF